MTTPIRSGLCDYCPHTTCLLGNLFLVSLFSVFLWPRDCLTASCIYWASRGESPENYRNVRQSKTKKTAASAQSPDPGPRQPCGLSCCVQGKCPYPLQPKHNARITGVIDHGSKMMASAPVCNAAISPQAWRGRSTPCNPSWAFCYFVIL